MSKYDLRIEQLRRLMLEKSISFYIINTSDPHFSEYIDDHYKIREYMSGFTGSAGTLVVSKDATALFVDGRYHIQADIETSDSSINVYKLGAKDVPSVYTYISERVDNDAVIGFNGKCFSQNEFETLAKKINKTISFSIEDNLIENIDMELPEISCNTVISIPIELSGEDVSEKLNKVRSFIKAKKADGFFVSSLDDIMWLFNIRGRDILYNTTAYAYAYITMDSATLYLQNGTYDADTNEKLNKHGVIIAEYSEIELELCKLKSKTILLDKAYTSCYFFKIIDTGNDIKQVNNYDLIKKYIKNTTECDNARKYAITDAIAMISFIKKIKEDVRAGVSYNEYSAKELLDEIRSRQNGFYSLSFETISAYKENAAIVHYSPDINNSKIIRNSGFLLVDSGSHYFGATTDITRTIAFDEISPEEKRAFTYVLKGNIALMDAEFLDGTSCEALDILARTPLWKEKLDYLHGTGHGIGSFLNVHEGPVRISYKGDSKIKMKEGMIVSDEPGLYVSGQFGIRHETQLLCVKLSENEYGTFLGFEPLSLVPFDIDAIDVSLLSAEEKNILNRYHSRIRDTLCDYLDEDTKIWLKIATRVID